jgi:hypothetical protein
VLVDYFLSIVHKVRISRLYNFPSSAEAPLTVSCCNVAFLLACLLKLFLQTLRRIEILSSLRVLVSLRFQEACFSLNFLGRSIDVIFLTDASTTLAIILTHCECTIMFVIVH